MLSDPQQAGIGKAEIAEIPERCIYCLGEPDHKHKPTSACGDCCAMHGGLATSKHEYRWVQDIVTKHNAALGAAESQLLTANKHRDSLIDALHRVGEERDAANETISQLKGDLSCKCSNSACDCQWRHTCDCPAREAFAHNQPSRDKTK
jgi:hypothetical protein